MNARDLDFPRAALDLERRFGNVTIAKSYLWACRPHPGPADSKLRA